MLVTETVVMNRGGLLLSLCCRVVKTRRSRRMRAVRTAGVVVVGDEVLRGAVRDSNTHFLGRELHRLGVQLLKVSVLPDDVDALADELREFSRKFDVVLSCGGVGPTHDDRTYEAVARALDAPLELNSEVADEVVKNHGDRNSALKMAMVPRGCRLHHVADTLGTSITKPIVQVGNVFVLPGSPSSVQRAFAQLEDEIRGGSGVEFHGRELHLGVPEHHIVAALNRAVELFRGQVTFGSYPNCGDWAYPTKITLESTSRTAVSAALRFLRSSLHPDWVVGGDVADLDPMDDLVRVADSAPDASFQKAVRDAVQVVNECCDRYSPDELVLSFNGGKDATALLHVACVVVRHRYPEFGARALRAFWVHGDNAYPEQREFVDRMVKKYNLDIEELPGQIKPALERYLKQHPQVKAALLGTRRTDPHSTGLAAFQETDPGWPKVMRVSPILDWSYSHVWTFLRELGVAYCSLYDQG